MENIGVTIIGIIISRLIFNLLFNILNNKVCSLFVEIEKDLSKLSNKTKLILKLAGNALAISIVALIDIRLGISRLGVGLILGFFMAIIDICFGEGILRNATNENGQ
ncbi:MAG: hypothetical protein ACRDD7_07595 [Peptostreptococcaceae bacterium]